MNTRDTGPKAKNKAQTGDTRLLNGYKVGMRDPNGYGARLAAKVWHVAPDGRWGCRPCPACAASPPSHCEVASFNCALRCGHRRRAEAHHQVHLDGESRLL